MSKTNDVVGSEHPDPALQWERLEQQKAEEVKKISDKQQRYVNAIKDKLFNQMEEAGKTLQTLAKIGIADIFKVEPRFEAIVKQFNIQTVEPEPEEEPEKSSAKGSRGKNIKSEDFVAAVKETLEGGKQLTHAEIRVSDPIKKAYAAVQKSVPPQISAKLDKLESEGVLVKDGKMKNARYSLKK